MVEVKDLSFTYPNGKSLAFGDFSIQKGQHSLLLGDSGSGKTTLLHLLGGLLRGYSGLIKIDHSELSELSDALLDKFRGKHCGFIFQKLHLVKALNVRRNLVLSSWLAGMRAEEEWLTTALEKLNIKDKADADVNTLSQGQAQRVAIARAVLNRPALILADEPTSALDDRNCEDVLKLLIDVASEAGSTLIIATHDQRLKSRIGSQIQIGR